MGSPSWSGDHGQVNSKFPISLGTLSCYIDLVHLHESSALSRHDIYWMGIRDSWNWLEAESYIGRTGRNLKACKDLIAGSTGMSPCRNTLIQVLTLWWMSSPSVWQLRFKVQEENFWGAYSVIVPEQECNIIALASIVGCGSHLAECYTRIPKDRDWHYLLRVWGWTIKKQHVYNTDLSFLSFRYIQLTYITIYLCVYSFIGGEMMTNNDVCKSH